MIDFKSRLSSPVLTAAETVRWLRLDEDHDDPGLAIKALYRLVQEKRLRPLRVGKSYKFTTTELERFVSNEVERGTPDPSRNGLGDHMRLDSQPSAHRECTPTRPCPDRKEAR